MSPYFCVGCCQPLYFHFAGIAAPMHPLGYIGSIEPVPMHPLRLYRQYRACRAASFDKPYGFSGSPRHTLFIFLFVVEICVLKIKITTTQVAYMLDGTRDKVIKVLHVERVTYIIIRQC